MRFISLSKVRRTLVKYVVSHGLWPGRLLEHARLFYIWPCMLQIAQPGRGSANYAAMFDHSQTYYWQIQDCAQNCGGTPPNENRCCCTCCSGGCCCGLRHERCLHCYSTSRPADPMTLAQIPPLHYASGISLDCLSHAPKSLPISAMPREACSYCLMVNNSLSRAKRIQTRNCSN